MNIFFILPEGVRTILNSLHANGYEAYVVGGCVRDKLIDRIPYDWDICTSATPSEVTEVFSKNHIIDLGTTYGTVSVIIDGASYEVTTYRVDGKYSDDRRPDNVLFTTSLEEDLARRDFTINALAYNEESGLIDPFNGMSDLDAKIIRCVGNPRERLTEDSLRIVRALRFSIQLGFEIEVETYDSMLSLRHLFYHLSKERLSAELLKILNSGEKISKQFLACRDIVGEIVPEFELSFDFNQNNPYHKYDVYTHILHSVDAYTGNDIETKLALLFHDIGKPFCYSEDENGGHFPKHSVVGADITRATLTSLRFDNNTIECVTQLVLYHDALIYANCTSVKRMLNKIGETQFRRLLDIREADILAQSDFELDIRLKRLANLKETLEITIKEDRCFKLSNLEVNGKDLIAIGYKEGRALGSALKGLLECVMSDEVENEKTSLLELASKWLIN